MSFFFVATKSFLTVLTEAFTLLIFRQCRKRLKEYFFLILIVNMITQPILWYLNVNFELNLIFSELVIIVTEFLIIYSLTIKRVRLQTILGLSLLANLTSFIMGGIIYSFTAFVL